MRLFYIETLELSGRATPSFTPPNQPRPIKLPIRQGMKERIQQRILGVVTQRLQLLIDDFSTGGVQYRVSGGGVPFAGEGEARIPVGGAFGEGADLERAAHVD